MAVTKVYVVCIYDITYVDDRLEEIIDIFSDKEKAEHCKKTTSVDSCHSVVVEEWEVK